MLFSKQDVGYSGGDSWRHNWC